MRTLVARKPGNPDETVGQPLIQKDNPNLPTETLLVIPTLNEENAIGDLLTEAHTCGFEKILVVDGQSNDRTREVAEKAGAQVILQNFGKGKGCGIRTAMREFLMEDANVLAIIDGDGTNDPSCLPEMVSIVKQGEADVVMGSRTKGSRKPHSMPLISLASNITVSFLLGAKFRRLFTDVQTGYWVFTKNAVERIYSELRSTGFEVELEIFVTVFKTGLSVREIPVGFRVRKGKTKFSFKMRIRNLYYAFKFLAS
jgi:glycosyltransferase involved in cell wall biosynthesis